MDRTTFRGTTPPDLAAQEPSGRSVTRFGSGPRRPRSRSSPLLGTHPRRAFTPYRPPSEALSTVGRFPISRPLPIHRETVPPMLARKPPESVIPLDIPQVLRSVTVILPIGGKQGGLAKGAEIQNVKRTRRRGE